MQDDLFRPASHLDAARNGTESQKHGTGTVPATEPNSVCKFQEMKQRRTSLCLATKNYSKQEGVLNNEKQAGDNTLTC